MRHITLLFLIIITGTTLAQEYVFHRYTVDDGLLDDEVFDILQDKRGYLWFATNSGVNRFDGYSFESFTVDEGMVENPTLELYEDHYGRIWFIPFDCRFSYYDNGRISAYRHNDRIFNFKSKNAYRDKTFILDTNDRVSFVSTQHKISIDSSGQDISIDKGCIASFEDMNFYTVLNIGPELNYKDRYVLFTPQSEFYKSVRDTLWLPYNIELSKYSRSLIFRKKYKDDHIISHSKEILFTKDFSSFERMDFDRRIVFLEVMDNYLWVSIIKGGVYQYDLNDLNRPPVRYFKDQSITAMVKDKQNGLWFSSTTHGVYHLADHLNKCYEIGEQKPHPIVGLAVMDSTVLMTTEDGRLAYINNEKKELSYQTTEEVNHVKNFQWNPYTNELYLGGELLYIFDGEKIRAQKNMHPTVVKRRGSLTHMIKSVFIEKDTTWIGSATSLLRYNNDQFTYNSFGDDSVYIRIGAISRDYFGNLWLGTTSGLVLYDNRTFTPYSDVHIKLSRRVSAICNDRRDSTLWIATHGSGLLNFNPVTNKVVEYTKNDGLLTNSIMNLHRSDSILWIGSNMGLMKMVLQDDHEKNEIYTYTVSDGLTSNKVNEILVFNDTVYVATDKGVVIFPERKTQLREGEMPVYITNVRVMDQDTTFVDGLNLNHNQNFLSISYVGISFKEKGHIKYNYKLEGLSDKWNCTYNTNIKFASLSPGDYVFKVKALNKSGDWSPAAELKIHIKTPFWNTIGFKLSVIALILILFVVIMRFRIFRLKKENQLKESVITFRQKALAKQVDPHFIYNSLNSIQSFILKNDNLVAIKYLAKFSKLMRKILNNSTEPLIAISEEIEAVSLYLELERVRFNKKFDFEIEIDQSIRKDITYIPSFFLQPFIENSIWHGFMNLKKQGLIHIKLTSKVDAIGFEIKDNGIGREEAGKVKQFHVKGKTSMGIDISKQRIDLVNRQYHTNYMIQIDDLNNEDGSPAGTKVTFDLPCLEK